MLIGIVQGLVVAIPAGFAFNLLTNAIGAVPPTDGAASLLGVPLDLGPALIGFALFLFSFLMFTGLLVAIGAVMPSAKEAWQRVRRGGDGDVHSAVRRLPCWSATRTGQVNF